MSQENIYTFTVQTIDGKEASLKAYQGKTLLIVNVASFCGYTLQYEGLESLYKSLKEHGVVVLAFPCNQFGKQEPGSSEEIELFCTEKYNVTFPLFEKVDVNGTGAHPLFTWLTNGAGNKELAGEIKWNFEKFLVDDNGKLIKRFGTRTLPIPDIMDEILAITQKK